MPEGPECAATAQSINNFMSEKTLINVEVLSGRYTKKSPPGLAIFKEMLPLKSTGWATKGKFIYGRFKDDSGQIEDRFIWNTLGMSGYWSYSEKKHSRVRFDFDDGSSIWYTDTRNFGTLKFMMTLQQTEEKLFQLGPDPLTHDIHIDQFRHRLFKKNKKGEKTICEALMNQKTIAGVGNYIKAEVLWLSKISPLRTVNSLTEKEVVSLRDNIQSVIRTSYQNGGATIKSFYGADGSKGTYSSKFLVYNQHQDPYNNKVIKTKTPDGRTTHWVPEIQK
jgi:formamidopyrimidine-DNA glycosylase